ncbi:hypothetical protein DL89DRAFT_286252 [Linderina pennispora]|uniref:Uncharacterized protein n=1 Tax=Linderina pennispora TaxID=61395 RepID=A0A1Y1VZ42_9FUNG|nr:uncharacterized protein DL89DRAFT_286252 [Linderina pennispora]ORX66530.1 hypothetical protein DL89DRAFT_286252 [Linderina pennispora]
MAKIYLSRSSHISSWNKSTSHLSASFCGFFRIHHVYSQFRVIGNESGILAVVHNQGHDEKVDSIAELPKVIRQLKVDNTEFNAAVEGGYLARHETTTPGCDLKFRLVNIQRELSVFKFRTDDQYLQSQQKIRGQGIGSTWTWKAIWAIARPPHIT